MTVPKRFDILRFVSGLMKVFAWISLVLSILGAISVALFGGQVGQFAGDQLGVFGPMIGGVGGIIAAVLVLLLGLLYFVLLYAFGEGIAMLLAVEENTRLTAALLLKMHQDNQVDSRTAAYPGGFTSEPAPYK